MQGPLRHAIMWDDSNKSNEKQWLKSNKQIQHGVKIDSSLLHCFLEYILASKARLHTNHESLLHLLKSAFTLQSPFQQCHFIKFPCAACMLRHFSRVWFFLTLWTIARQAPQSVGFSGQEYWSGLPCPLPRDLSDSGIQEISYLSCICRWVLYH